MKHVIKKNGIFFDVEVAKGLTRGSVVIRQEKRSGHKASVYLTKDAAEELMMALDLLTAEFD